MFAKHLPYSRRRKFWKFVQKYQAQSESCPHMLKLPKREAEARCWAVRDDFSANDLSKCPRLAAVHRVAWKRVRGRRPVEKRLPDLYWTRRVSGVGSTIVRAFAGLPLRSFPTFSEVYQSLPSAYVRSSSVNWAYFCLSLPLTSFQDPLNCSLFMPTIWRRPGHRFYRSSAFLAQGFTATTARV